MLKTNFIILFFVLISTLSQVKEGRASSKNSNSTFFTEITSYGLKTSDSVASFEPKIGFEIKITSPNYNVLEANLNKTVINGIYQKGKYINGKFIYGDTNINVLDNVRIKNSYCKKDKCPSGRFSISKSQNDSLYLKYKNNSVNINDFYNYNINADIYVKVVGKEEKEQIAVIEDVIIKRTDLDISEIAKRNISRFQLDISNNEIDFRLKESGLKGGSEHVTYYGYKIINNNEDQFISRISILDADKEIFIDQKSYGGGIRSGSVNDIAYIPEEYIGKPLNIKVYYYKTQEHLIKFEKDLKQP
jgi:hypothetical protein